MELTERYRGCLLGLAVGDAVGTALEFSPPGSFAPITDLVGGGPFGLLPGQWTDDTSLALCLAESLLACNGFDPVDQMQRYVRWRREGYLSSTGECFDIGNTTATALSAFERSGRPYCGPTDPDSAGNGSLMRLAPVPMFYARRPAEAIAMAADSSRTTHGTRTAVDACRFLAALIVGALHGATKEELTAPGFSPVAGLWEREPLAAEINEIAQGSYLRRNPPEIRGSGYVVHTLEAALWAFYHSDGFRDGCLRVVNLGEDADTTGAVFGQLAGAYYGERDIPLDWRARLHEHDFIASLAGTLYNRRARQ
ncbi:MAG TPA: ADP-ribosylglycohydrolase family protein [Phycisphaerae bacterium]|nr:ADP-ribosylglycohydrolase family protein [Phycisphaerae bacterium]HNU46894.1 ADP-ribosylglycohydrolase family protein [Phycisphaerae bacterium]